MTGASDVRHRSFLTLMVCLILAGMSAVISGGAQAAALKPTSASATITATGTVEAPTCKVMIASSGGDKPQDMIAIEEQNQSTLLGGGVYAVTQFQLSLTECYGAGESDSYSQTPSIHVTGDTVSGSPYLFRTDSSQANQADPRFGFVVRTEAGTGTGGSATAAWDTSKQVADDTWVDTKINTQALLNSNTADRKTLDYWVGVSCGDLVMCSSGTPATSEGFLEADISFSFEYK
ncbi:hypothetical protein EKN34_13480 [Enterobacter asburiae]|nr:hypothetical protein EKN34_13480 [Enterobacter asburiae]